MLGFLSIFFMRKNILSDFPSGSHCGDFTKKNLPLVHFPITLVNTFRHFFKVRRLFSACCLLSLSGPLQVSFSLTFIFFLHLHYVDQIIAPHFPHFPSCVTRLSTVRNLTNFSSTEFFRCGSWDWFLSLSLGRCVPGASKNYNYCSSSTQLFYVYNLTYNTVKEEV